MTLCTGGALLLISTPLLHGDPLSLEGEVLAADGQALTLHLRYKGQIPGLSESSAGELTVDVSQGDALIGYVGRSIRGQLLSSTARWRLENIWPVNPDVRHTIDTINRQLRRDTATRGTKAFRTVGDYIPDFALYDQDGHMASVRQFRGKRIVLNFIFTRCAVPTMCPAATTNMVRLQKQARNAGVANLQLISISFDPEYDTPGILKQYAHTHGVDTGTFSLLTGPKRVITDLMTQFGILTEQEDGTIKHTMATLLIDEKGKIHYRREGSRWTPQSFLERLVAI